MTETHDPVLIAISQREVAQTYLSLQQEGLWQVAKTGPGWVHEARDQSGLDEATIDWIDGGFRRKPSTLQQSAHKGSDTLHDVRKIVTVQFLKQRIPGCNAASGTLRLEHAYEALLFDQMA